MTNLKLSAKQIQDVAKTASVDIRTLLKYLAGDKVRALAGARIRAALASAGLLVALLLVGCSDVTNAPVRPDTGSAGGEVELDAGAEPDAEGLPVRTPDATPSKPDGVLADRVLADTRPDAMVLADSLLADTWPAMPGACEVTEVLTYGNSCSKYWTGTKIACAHDCITLGSKSAIGTKEPCLTTGRERDPGGWTGKVVCLPSINDCKVYCTTPIN